MAISGRETLNIIHLFISVEKKCSKVIIKLSKSNHKKHLKDNTAMESQQMLHCCHRFARTDCSEKLSSDRLTREMSRSL